MLNAPLVLAPQGGDGSDGCARCFGTSGRPSPWSSLQPCITAVMWGPEKNDGLRAQTTACSGGRPGVLEEPEPQGGAVTVGYVAAPGPLPEVASMAGSDSVDGTALRFLVKKAL